MQTKPDPFDVAAAVYFWLTQNHEGQGSRAYELLSRLQEVFSPSYDIQCGRLPGEAPSILADIADTDDAQNFLQDSGVLS